MAEPFLGQLMLVPYNFAPRGWAFCQGQTFPIAQNTALFSLLGTTYGGDGQTTFKLPDLQGRVPVGVGQGPGLSIYDLGQVGGTESATLTQAQMPAHSHLATSSQSAATATRPSNQVPSAGGAYTAASDGTAMNPAHIQSTGGSQPFDKRPPYLALNWVIALQGIFPSRN